MPSKTARLKASVVYFWLDDSFTTMPLFRSGLLRSSAFSGWLGCSAWALSQLTRKEDAWARRKPSSPDPKAMQQRLKVSLSRVPMAPCLVLEPTSSLSKHASTVIALSFSLSKKACRQAKVPCRLSSFGALKNSLSAPQVVGSWRLTRNNSLERRSSGRAFACCATSRENDSSPSSPAESRGRRSIWWFSWIPLFTCWFMCMARLGMSRRSRSKCTSLLSTPVSVRTRTRPASVSGRSSQVESIMPPYPSTLRVR